MTFSCLAWLILNF